MHPLDGCWAKIGRADHNIDRLYSLAVSFLSQHGHDFRTDVNGRWAYRLAAVRSLIEEDVDDLIVEPWDDDWDPDPGDDRNEAWFG